MKKLFVLSILALSSSLLTLCKAQNKHVDSLKALYAKATNPMKRFDLLNSIINDFYRTGSGTLDLAYVTQLMDIALALHNDSLEAISYDQIGNYFDLTGDDSKALESLTKGLPLAEKINDKRRICSIYLDISNVYNDMSNPQEVLFYAKLGEAALPDKSSPLYDFMYIQYIDAMGYYYSYLQKPDSQLYYLNAEYELSRKMKNTYFEADALGGLANFYRKQSNAILADANYKAAIAVADSSHNNYYKFTYEIWYASFLLEQKKPEEAIREAEIGFEGSRKEKYNALTQQAAALLERIYDKKNNIDSAYYYARIETAMRDSINNSEKINKIQSMAFAQHLHTIEEDTRKAEEEQQRRQNIQYALIALGIVTFIILFLLLAQSIIIHEGIIKLLGVVALLIVFEFMNLLLHPLFGKITHENPLLMLLALVCVGALLVPLHHRLEKWATHRLVEKNKQIRLATAKKTIEKLENNKTN